MKYIIHLIRVLFFGLFIFLVTQGKMNVWLLIFALGLFLTIIFGRVYCGYVCVMNTVMVPVSKLSQKLGWQTHNKPKLLSNKIMPWISLIFSIVIVVIGKKVLQKNIPIMFFWILLSILITLRYAPEVFHNHVCPFGALLRITGKLSYFSKRVNKVDCIGCGKCVTVCPSESIELSDIKKAEISTETCHQCTKCTDVCPTNAIGYQGKMNHNS